MLRRIIVLLLIPLLVTSPELCFAHSHRGTGMTEPVDHAARPHVHSHKHHHHHGDRTHHRHDQKGSDPSGTRFSAPAGDHDDDATYAPGPLDRGISRSPSQRVIDQQLVTGFLDEVFPAQANPTPSVEMRCQPPPGIDGGGLFFTRTVSLRI